MQFGYKIKNKSSSVIEGLDLDILSIMFVIGCIYSRCLFILYESNFQSNFRRVVLSVEYSTSVKKRIVFLNFH